MAIAAKVCFLTVILMTSAFGRAELVLPKGFEATVYHDGVGKARHLAVTADGALLVRLATGHDNPGVLLLQDEDNDGRADRETRLLSDAGGTGIEIDGDQVVYSTDTAVYGLPLQEARNRVAASTRQIIGGFPRQSQHAAKSLALAPDGRTFVNVGAPSNACQREMRTPGSPGQRPCPQLKRQGGIWTFDRTASDQNQQNHSRRYVTGLRNAVALAWHPTAEKLFLVQHGRDQLHSLWKSHFTVEENARLPAEEFHGVEEGSNLGWPFTYYDGIENRRMKAPEYGGDGETPAKTDYREPLVAFPAHWGPNDLVFYEGDQFPEGYRHGAFIAFHGSWNRAPEPQAGYVVVFVPMDGTGQVIGDWQVFADGFIGRETIYSPGQAQYRPTSVAVAPDGSLFIGDSTKGRIWRVRFKGEQSVN